MSSEKRRALISVSDKTGIIDLARELTELGYEIVSTGGTARTLRDASISVTEAADVTGFPEILGGRVKTLHPLIHGAILARLDLPEQQNELEEHGIIPFEIVVVNLYPFEETVARDGVRLEEAIENIDIGGPAMLRAAAKNHNHVAVMVNPARYNSLLDEIKAEGSVGKSTRCKLAAEAFAHTAAYDAAITKYLNTLYEYQAEKYPEYLPMALKKIQDLRYGENPQQLAAFYADSGPLTGLAAARQLQGKELSFNNINDLNAALELVLEFDDPTVVAVKHANPCGVGSGPTIFEAYNLAYDADPVSIFGGVLALNRPVGAATARVMVEIFLEVIAAPGFTAEALEILKEKSDIRLLDIQLPERRRNDFDLKKVIGGMLTQTLDREKVDVRQGTVVTEKKPGDEEWKALDFAQKVVKHVRSNAIVVAGSNQTFGVGAGQMNRIGAAKIALAQAGEKARGAVLGSDAFFPFPDTVDEAAKAGIKAIVQPGGSLRDEESIRLCNQLGLVMVFTGRRYFKH